MRILRLYEFNENWENIKLGDVVIMNNPPRPDLVGAPFIVKVDRGYEVIIFQLKPDLSEEQIQLTLDTPHYGTDEEKKKWYSIGTIKDYMPINIQKHRLTKI